MIVQRIEKKEKDKFFIAKKYYTLLFNVNDINVTEREVQLVSFMAINGSISYRHVKEEFCKEFNSTSATINNMVSRLKNLGIFIKDNGKIKVNSSICLDFSKDITLQIKIVHETP